MAAITLPAATAAHPKSAPQRRVRPIYVIIEMVVLVLVCSSPWAFGAVHPVFEFVLYAGVGVLLLLWGAALVLDGQLSWKKCPVALGLGALFILGVCQLLPLPAWLLETVAPATASTCRELLPARPEAVTPGEPAPAAALPAGAALSLYPGATRQAVLRLLAVFCLFAVVRNTVASPGALRRFSLFALVNGLALALFALLQFFTSPRFTLYWTYPTDGSVFGPFICRNHFSFYVNVCLGLGMGYLLSRHWAGGTRSARDRYASHGTPGLLQQPAVLWVAAALAVIVSAAFFSLSRGGFVALFAGVLLALVVLWSSSTRGSSLAVWLVTGLLAFGLLAWYGWPRVEARLVSMWASPTAEGRLPVWSNCLPLLKRYPVFGTGYGTFRYVEPLQRTPGDNPDEVYEYAHNDYLEAAVEGGAVRLLVSLVVIALVYRLGFRAYRRYRGHATGGLVLGGLVAFTTVVVHSFVDFGLHMPAIAVLVTVLCAHLAALGARRGTSGESEEDAYALRLAGVGPGLGIAAAALLAFVLTAEGWKLSQAERYHLAARHLALATPPVPRDRQIDYLRAAVQYEPADAALQIALADAHFFARQEASAGSVAARAHSLAAARHYLLARNLCPLLPQPHVRLAALADSLAEADPSATFLRRATVVRPADAHLWYLTGVQELADGHTAEACRCWRQALLASDKYLEAVLKAGAKELTADQWTRDVLPDRPASIEKAAWLLHSEADAADARKPFLEAALERLENRPVGMLPDDYRLRGKVQDELGRTDDAVKSYQLALSRKPSQADWRLELVKLLIRRKQFDLAQEALGKVPHDHPGYAESQEALRTAQEAIKDNKE